MINGWRHFQNWQYDCQYVHDEVLYISLWLHQLHAKSTLRKKGVKAAPLGVLFINGPGGVKASIMLFGGKLLE